VDAKIFLLGHGGCVARLQVRRSSALSAKTAVSLLCRACQPDRTGRNRLLAVSPKTVALLAWSAARIIPPQQPAAGDLGDANGATMASTDTGKGRARTGDGRGEEIGRGRRSFRTQAQHAHVQAAASYIDAAVRHRLHQYTPQGLTLVLKVRRWDVCAAVCASNSTSKGLTGWVKLLVLW
jgi:hypothetical protein